MPKKAALIIVLSSFICLSVQSQLCQGSLGDPVVHITFGSGNGAGNPLRAAATTYNFRSTDCPDDGWYTIQHFTNACFGSTWHTVSEDHTPGDQNGYMMIVNASFQPGDFYVDTVRGLCANTTYEFAAWIMNVLRPTACGNGIDPNLTFRIETTTGAVLATYQTGNIAEYHAPAWQQYGVFFQTTAASTSVVVRITNNAPGGCGNDLLLDDITFRPCGPKVSATLTISGDTAVDVCDGNTTSYQLGSTTSAGYSDPVFQWQVSVDNGNWTDIPGATGSTWLRQPTPAGNYRYRLSVTERNNQAVPDCRVASNMVVIAVHPLPDPQVADETPGCEGTSLTLQATGGTGYSWTGPNGFTASEAQPSIAVLQPGDAGKYYVSVTSDKGCLSIDSTNLVVHPAVSAAVNNNLTACEGVPVQLHASGGVRYAWSPATGLNSVTDASPLAAPADTTQYTVTVFNQHGCFDTASVLLQIWKKPKAIAGSDKHMIEGQSVVLDGAAAGTQVSWYWSPPAFLNDAGQLTPVAGPSTDMTYTLNVVSNLGCGAHTDKVFVRVYKDVKIPNAFSPNGDGINDTWKIENLHTYPEASLQVFNRHGQLVYESKGYGRPWNGTTKGQVLPVGTYYYLIDLKTDIFPKMSGWIFIVR